MNVLLKKTEDKYCTYEDIFDCEINENNLAIVVLLSNSLTTSFVNSWVIKGFSCLMADYNHRVINAELFNSILYQLVELSGGHFLCPLMTTFTAWACSCHFSKYICVYFPISWSKPQVSKDSLVVY